MRKAITRKSKTEAKYDLSIFESRGSSVYRGPCRKRKAPCHATQGKPNGEQRTISSLASRKLGVPSNSMAALKCKC
jgi:hypothetical protein